MLTKMGLARTSADFSHPITFMQMYSLLPSKPDNSVTFSILYTAKLFAAAALFYYTSICYIYFLLQFGILVIYHHIDHQ